MQTYFRNTVSGKDGRYSIPLEQHGGGFDFYRYKVRIEADGYRSTLSDQSFGLDEGHVTANFSLEPAPSRHGRVVDSAGRPVASATIAIASPSIVPLISNQDIQVGHSLETLSDGKFQIAATSEPVRIRAIHEQGFAEVLRQPNEPIGRLQIQPWAGVSGRLIQDGKPVPNERIYFHPLLPRDRGDAHFQDSYTSQTDEEGRFEFVRLPPISGNLRAYLGPWKDSPLTSSQSIPLALRPGDQHTVTLGGQGVTLTGRIVATGRGDTPLNKNWSLNYLVRRGGGIEIAKDLSSLRFNQWGVEDPYYLLEDESKLWMNSRINYFVKPTPDGQIRIGGVSPGTYDLVLRLYEQPTGCLVETVGEKVVTIEVTEADAAAGQKDLGDIEVACRIGPRIGQNMQAYKFTDVTGRERTVYEMKGQYVLMHVWASWCAPCLSHMPQVKSTLAKLPDQQIVFVGLNIDEEPERGKSLVREGKWNWAQNYLGSHSDMIRQLGLSSVPTYYLIGPDGTLAAVSNEWAEMKVAIEKAFENIEE